MVATSEHSQLIVGTPDGNSSIATPQSYRSRSGHWVRQITRSARPGTSPNAGSMAQAIWALFVVVEKLQPQDRRPGVAAAMCAAPILYGPTTASARTEARASVVRTIGSTDLHGLAPSIDLHKRRLWTFEPASQNIR
jgi:hypothetical protein